MGNLEARLDGLVSKHHDRIVDYHELLLHTTTDLLKDRKTEVGVKGSLTSILRGLNLGLKRESSSRLTSSDRVLLTQTLLESGESLARILQDSGFNTQVTLIENEIRQLSGEISALEEERDKALSENRRSDAHRLGSTIKKKSKKKK